MMARQLSAHVIRTTAVLAALFLEPPHAQVFRTATEAVLIDVSVRQNGVFVRDLAKDDFIVLDNGVRQHLAAVEIGTMPLHLITIVDTSQSITDRVRASFMRLVYSLKSLATPQDTFQLIQLDGTVQRILAGTELPAAVSQSQARTALLDGLAVVLLSPAEPGYRRLIVTLTDGTDTSSLLPSNIITSIAQRSDAVLYVIAVKDPRVPRPWSGHEWHYDMLERMTAPSGGKFAEISLDSELTPYVGALVEEMRQRYLLHYIPNSVTVSGWHEIVVQLARPGRYILNARRGYHAGNRQHQ